jgi:hypothetical protein
MEYRFCDKREIARLIGLSTETLKKLRLSGALAEGIHWVRHGTKRVVFNFELMRDWNINRCNPQVHQLAIDAFLASLPSSKAAAAITPKGRKANARNKSNAA